MERRPTKRKWIAVEMARSTSIRHQRELDGFVRYCALRIEKELGQRECWTVRITTSGAIYSSRVTSEHLGIELEATGTGPDAELATWDAMCRVEQQLRERRAGSVGRATPRRQRRESR